MKVVRGGDYEASLLGRLDYPNIVPVYSAVHDPERYVSYICMPFRGRNTLKELVDCIREFGVPHHAAAIVNVARGRDTAH